MFRWGLCYEVGGLLLPLVLLLLLPVLLLRGGEHGVHLVLGAPARAGERDAEQAVRRLHVAPALLAGGLLQAGLGARPRELPRDALGDLDARVVGHLREELHHLHAVDDLVDHLLPLGEPLLLGLLRLLLELLLVLLARLALGLRLGELAVLLEADVGLEEREHLAVHVLSGVVLLVVRVELVADLHDLREDVDEALDRVALLLVRDVRLLVVHPLLLVALEADLHADHGAAQPHHVLVGAVAEDLLRNLRPVLLLLRVDALLEARRLRRRHLGDFLPREQDDGLLRLHGVQDRVQLLLESVRLFVEGALLLLLLARGLFGLAHGEDVVELRGERLPLHEHLELLGRQRGVELERDLEELLAAGLVLANERQHGRRRTGIRVHSVLLEA